MANWMLQGDGTLRQFADFGRLDFGNTSWTLAPSWSMRPTLRIPTHLANLETPLLVMIGCVAWFVFMSMTCWVLVMEAPRCTRMWSRDFARCFPSENGRMVITLNTVVPTSRRPRMVPYDFTTHPTWRRSNQWHWENILGQSLNSPARRSPPYVVCWVLCSGLQSKVRLICRLALPSTLVPSVVGWSKQLKRPIACSSSQRTTPT